jgi:hypothetical protein
MSALPGGIAAFELVAKVGFGPFATSSLDVGSRLFCYRSMRR